MRWFGVFLAGILLAAGGRAEEFDGTLRIAGSTTLLPVVADAASQFMERYGTWDKVDPALPLRSCATPRTASARPAPTWSGG